MGNSGPDLAFATLIPVFLALAGVGRGATKVKIIKKKPKNALPAEQVPPSRSATTFLHPPHPVIFFSHRTLPPQNFAALGNCLACLLGNLALDKLMLSVRKCSCISSQVKSFYLSRSNYTE